MAKTQPTYKITFYHKGTKKNVQELSIPVWPKNENAPGFVVGNVGFPKGAKIKLEDGTVVELSDYYCSLVEPFQDKGDDDGGIL